MKKHKPYIETEAKVMGALVLAVNSFIRLKMTHPSHMQDFVDGIHKCQNIIVHRIIQRDYPVEFPIYTVEKGVYGNISQDELKRMSDDLKEKRRKG